MAAMLFRCLTDPAGNVQAIEPAAPWLPEMWVSKAALDHADPRFIAHGDGLISFYCRNETATYGIVGEDEACWWEPVYIARFLNVRPAEDA